MTNLKKGTDLFSRELTELEMNGEKRKKRSVPNSRERNYVNMQVNPCKMCMPMGASQAMRGIKKSMTIIHGSQGCSTYIRRHMAAHYNEPIDIASSSLSEEGTVYGGSRNLKIGISNMVKMYQPEVVGVLTSCLAETIGDDIARIVKEVRDTGEFEGIDIIPIATPGYGGSQSEGYFAAIRSMVKYYSEMPYDYKVKQGYVNEDEGIEEGNHINIIVSNATCEDIRELKRLVSLMGIKAIFAPDISDVLDGPYREDFEKLSSDGTSREALMQMMNAKATIELGDLVADQYSPAVYLDENHGVSAYRMPVPIGIHNTDRFVESIASIYGIDIPDSIALERGRLIDGMIDSHKHSALGKVALFGDMDLVFGISSLMLENGVKVKVASTGSLAKKFKTRLDALLEQYGMDGRVMQDSDFETIREVIREDEVNLMIGNSNGKFIWEKDGVDLVRVGFPVHDHIGAQRKMRMGYKGSMMLLDEVVNKLLDQKHSSYKQRMFDWYHPDSEMRQAEPMQVH